MTDRDAPAQLLHVLEWQDCPGARWGSPDWRKSYQVYAERSDAERAAREGDHGRSRVVTYRLETVGEIHDHDETCASEVSA